MRIADEHTPSVSDGAAHTSVTPSSITTRSAVGAATNFHRLTRGLGPQAARFQRGFNTNRPLFFPPFFNLYFFIKSSFHCQKQRGLLSFCLLSLGKHTHTHTHTRRRVGEGTEALPPS